MLIVGGIVLIDVCINVPLLTLEILNGDISLTLDIFQSHKLNVSIFFCLNNYNESYSAE